MDQVSEGVVEQLIVEDIESIASRFEEMYANCVKNVKKPIVLVAGVTGAGKSSLVNAIFGSKLAAVGDSIPVTEHYTLFAPPDKPVVVYDSKGLEAGCHEEFIASTRDFFRTLRAKPDLSDHIHVIWYVVNAASGRFEPFEVTLIREVFAPTPVLFVLNKADIASAEQLVQLKKVIEDCKFESGKGVFLTVSERRNNAQNWCAQCMSDDVSYRSTTRDLTCEKCGACCPITRNFGLGPLIDATAAYLPDLAKEAFLNAQEVSLQERDKHAKELVKLCSKRISMDIAGNALNEMGQMIVRIFVLWGYNFLGIKLSARLAMIAADAILKRRLSRSCTACLGIAVNKPLRQISKQLLEFVDENGAVDLSRFKVAAEKDTELEKFMKTAFEKGIDAAIDLHWNDAAAQ